MFIQNLKQGLYLYLFSCCIIIFYILLLAFIGHTFLYEKASGNLIYDNHGAVRGSLLIAQQYHSDKYFIGRISDRFDSNCDVAIYNSAFKDKINQRYKEHGSLYDIIMVVPSSSLLDPYITRREAIKQAPRVASARKMELAEVIELINKFTHEASFPFFVLDILNVTVINTHLDGYNAN